MGFPIIVSIVSLIVVPILWSLGTVSGIIGLCIGTIGMIVALVGMWRSEHNRRRSDENNVNDVETEFKKILHAAQAARHKAFVFLKNSTSESRSLEDMITKLINLASNFGGYQLFFKLSRHEKSLLSNDKIKFERVRYREDTNCSIEAIENKIESEEERLEREKIIPEASFKGTIVPDSSNPIKDVDITVSAIRNDNLKIKAVISPDHQDNSNNELFWSAVYEKFKIPTIFSLEEYQSQDFELSVEQMRIHRHEGDITGKEINCVFHVEKGVLTIPRENNDKMVQVNILKLLGNDHTSSKISLPFGTFGTIVIGSSSPYNKSPVAPVYILPLEGEETSSEWYSNSRKALKNSVPLMRFITAESLEVSLEECRHVDKSEFYFDKDIEKGYPILADHSAKTLLTKIFKESSREGFAEDISKLAEAIAIANTYSPSWKIRLICMIEALEVWGSHKKLNLLDKYFRDKLHLFFKKYIGKDRIKYNREELNRVRNNLMHKGIATPVKLGKNDNKDKFYEQKDKSKYYFFKFREIFVKIFLHELNWEGKYYAYSCDKKGVVTRTEEKRESH